VKALSPICTALAGVLLAVTCVSSAIAAPGQSFEVAEKHWSYQPLRTPALPKVQTASRVQSPIDAFLLAARDQRAHFGFRVQPMPKAEALQEAKRWLRNLTAKEVEQGLSALPRGKVIEKPAVAPPGQAHPYEHPYFWAAFILIGDPN